MSKTRRIYDKQFKLMAIELSKNRSDLTVLAEELGIRPELIYRWRRELLSEPGSSFPGNGKVIQTEQQAEIVRLKKQLRDAELERDILKKAVSIFSRSDGRSTNS